MAWGRRTTSARTPAWSQDDYRADFAAKIKDQIEQGVVPWHRKSSPDLRSFDHSLNIARRSFMSKNR